MNSAVSNTRRNVGLLAACQAMLFVNSTTMVSVNGLAGLALAPHPLLTTLPVTAFVVGGALTTMRASLYMKKVGRQSGLIRGAAIAILGSLLCTAAIWMQNFWLLCFGTLVFGIFNAFGQYYRFVAADAAPADYKATAISMVMAGGLVGGIIGPNLSRYTVDLAGPRFAGAYLVLILFALVTMALLSMLRIPAPSGEAQAVPNRPLREIARQPRFVVAVLCGSIGFGVMNFLMTSTPISMKVCGHPYGDAAFVISSHVVGMFGPSFFTGGLIRRFGVIPVLFAGVALNVGAVAVALSGVSVAQFWWALVLLGVGWNFLYIGGTTLLTETYRPEERAVAQGANESATFGMMVLSSIASGMIVTSAGWEKVNLAALPLIAVVLVAVTWLWLRERAPRPAGA